MKTRICLTLAVVTLSAIGCGPWGSVRRVDFGPWATNPHHSARQCRLGSARSFAVVLKNLDIDAILNADPDVLVVDWFGGSNPCGELDARQLERLRARPDGSRGDRIVLAWIDIGRPEAVRPVFRPVTSDGSCQPAVLIPTSSGVEGGAALRPDDPAWKAALCEGRESVVSRVLDLGFDGIYLTGMSAGIAALVPDQTAAMKMGALFDSVVESARSADPDFMVVAADPVVLAGGGFTEKISGVAFHDQLFSRGYVRPADELIPVLERLNALRAAGVPVLSVEFIDDAIQESHYAAICRDFGFLCCSSVREFNHLEPLVHAGNGAGCQ